MIQQRRQALKKASALSSTIPRWQNVPSASTGISVARRNANSLPTFSLSLLENSYAGKIESYNNEKIEYLKETVDGNYAEVRSKVITPKRDEYSLDYRLLNENGKWMVYDVVIEGVSLVSNYRTQFNKIITTNGYNELVKKLQTKTDELKAP